MAVTTNTQEKQELFKTIWRIANELRGKVDGWDFKSYVLGTIFYRYLSENITERVNKQEHEAGDPDFDYAKLSDSDIDAADGFKQSLIEEIGFFIYPSQLFLNVTAGAKDNEDLNVTLDKVFTAIENSAKGSESEKCFSGLFGDFDVNSNKLGATVAKRNETLTKLLVSVRDMNFGSYTENTVDLLGDAYEYLMGMYASNAGKSGGEYYTPQEVSTLLTKICIVGKKRVNKVYDPCCGSGSLLLKSAKLLGRDKVDQGYFGQEVNITTYNLCRINMFLHNIGYDKFDIACEDTLLNPMHWDEEPFEVIVSNPPYSIKWVGDDDVTLINDPRFSPAGVLAPKKAADFAFIMHMISWLAPNGTAAVVCFPGIMYRGGAEQKIRQYLVDNNYVDTIIQLPENLFFGTSVSTCILVMKKNKVDDKILFIDASKEFVKDVNSNRLDEETNVENILKYYTDRIDVKHTVALVGRDRVAASKYNLSVSTYVEKEDTREVIDIDKLNRNIEEVVAKENQLRTDIAEIIKEIG
ncbi:MAG: type I restriction-modification system subunit M [Lachnospiraceae bacterium]|nr:type I restriction-modification system subunit M [Lachnospiraceae bacterium]